MGAHLHPSAPTGEGVAFDPASMTVVSTGGGEAGGSSGCCCCGYTSAVGAGTGLQDGTVPGGSVASVTHTHTHSHLFVSWRP